MVGSSILNKLKDKGFNNILHPTRKELNLYKKTKVMKYLKQNNPEFVLLCAARVGGIAANDQFNHEFLIQNIEIQNNVIYGSHIANIKNLLFLGSSCIYPKNCKQPIKENYLLSNYLEKTNDAYAVAKIAGVKLCESYNFQYNLNYKCLMPCNAYGINDNYNINSSHFLPALIKKIIEALRNSKDYIKILGSGKALRELIYCDDIADACIYFLRKKTKDSLINIGTGIEKSILDYTKYIMKHLEVELKIIHEKKHLDGTLRKLLDTSLAKKYGWKYKTSLQVGLSNTINDYLQNNVIKK